jgi:dUTP pyrophosphatase
VELAQLTAEPVDVLIRRLDPELPLPAYALPGDAGADLRTAVDVELGPGERAVVPTGIAVAMPEGYAAFVHPRSGLAARYGVSLVNLDPKDPVSFTRGDRVAQLVFQRVERARFTEVDELPGSERGDGGHGSTGR